MYASLDGGKAHRSGNQRVEAEMVLLPNLSDDSHGEPSFPALQL